MEGEYAFPVMAISWIIGTEYLKGSDVVLMDFPFVLK